MTNHEAISYLCNLRVAIGRTEHQALWHYEQPLAEIVDMLSEEPKYAEPETHDLISRKAAIDALTHKWDGMVTSVFDVLKELPSAEPQWIPVSERLPEKHDEVLVTARGEVSIAWMYLDEKWRSNDMPEPMFKDIIAWMPLPEPARLEKD